MAVRETPNNAGCKKDLKRFHISMSVYLSMQLASYLFICECVDYIIPFFDN